jgi:hypothetical protein
MESCALALLIFYASLCIWLDDSLKIKLEIKKKFHLIFESRL